jgi:hypothetical protein
MNGFESYRASSTNAARFRLHKLAGVGFAGVLDREARVD